MASEESIKTSQELAQTQPIYKDEHGKVYRFLRRGKRKVKNILGKMGIKK